MKFYIFFLLAIGILGSCKHNAVFEESFDIAEDGWREMHTFNYNLTIEDEKQPYNLYYNIRYNNEYQTYNLYIKQFILDSTGKQISSKLQGMDLFRPTSGQPYGKGLGGIFDYKILGISNYQFPHPGKYTIQVKQYMRHDPLKGILAFGIILDKNTPETQRE